jgi:DNA-binding winged helix-turn-helix (wHTH) protein
MDRQTQQLYEFGPFRLDPAERLLLREGRPVRLTPKAFAVLVMLVERGGRLVERGELMEALWPGVFVEDGNVDNCVHLLRKALGDGQSYIETVPKHGYRFVADM